MSWATVAAVGGSLLGGMISSSSSKKAGEQQAAGATQAANLQLQGTREGNALVGGMYKNNVQLQAPQLRAGQQALSALQSGMGLGPLLTGGGRPNTNGDVGGGGGGQFMDASGRPYTGRTMNNAQGQTTDEAGNILTAAQDFGGNVGINQDEANMAAGPYAGTFLEKFTNQDIYRDPSYQFRLGEGERSMRAQQAASGNRFGGQAMKDITNYAQGAASQEFGNAYNRFIQQKEQLYNRLSGIAGTGQTATGQLGQAGMNAGGQMSGNITQGYSGAAGGFRDAATARAGGTMGSTNALVGGLNQAANTWLSRDYFNRVNGGG